VLSVALTGNIASGKSEVARVFAQLGATVIDADRLAREVVEPGTPALGEIVARWGDGVLHADGTLDRDALRRIVFRSEAERAALNDIVHPRVQALRDVRMAEAAARGDPMVVSDIPLLFESHLEDAFDRIVLVEAPDAVRLTRLVQSRGLGEAEARRMMDAQMPSEAKRARAHFIIDNDGSLDDLHCRATEVWNALAAESGTAGRESGG
jgi:dephospho-CoA kinase